MDSDKPRGFLRRLFAFVMDLCKRLLAFLSKCCRLLLGNPNFVFLIAALALLLPIRSAPGGFAMDDHLYRASFDGFPGLPEYERPPLMGHLICSGDPDVNRALIDRGVFPWWGVPEGKLAFWRPLSTMAFWLDHTLFKNDALPMHLENLAWYALLGVLIALLYRRIIAPGWVAGLAALLYIVDNAHGFPVGWLCHRYMLMACVFGVGALLAHIKWRRDRWTPGVVVGPVLFALGLASGEVTLAFAAYLFAYAVFLEAGPWGKRLLPLAPYAAVSLAYLLMYRALGFGVSGTGWYVDPVGNPVRFLASAAWKLPYNLIMHFIENPGGLFWLFPGGLMWIAIAIIAFFLLGTIWLLWPMLRSDVTARFWAAGMLLSLIPVCAGVPQARYLFVPGIGGMALIGQYLGAQTQDRGWLGRGGGRWIPAKILGVLFILLHLVLAPYSHQIQAAVPRASGIKLEESFATIPSGAEASEQDVIILRAPHKFTPWYLAIMQSSMGKTYPAHVRFLSAGYRPMEIERVDEQRLALRPERGFVGDPGRAPYRSADYPMEVGEVVELTGMTVTVLAVDETGMPTEALFAFDKPLDAPSLVWLVPIRRRQHVERFGRLSRVDVFLPFTLPPVGHTVDLDTWLKETGVLTEADLQ